VPKTEKKGKHSKMDKSTKSSPRHEDTAKNGGKHEPGSTGKPDDKQHGGDNDNDNDDHGQGQGQGHDGNSDKSHKDDKGHGHDDSGDKGHGPKR
jgi:hypothetical protein